MEQEYGYGLIPSPYDIRDYVNGILDSPLLQENQDELMLTLQKNVDKNQA